MQMEFGRNVSHEDDSPLSPSALQVILDSEGMWAQKKEAAHLHHVTQSQLSSAPRAEGKLPLRRSVGTGMVPEAV